MIYQTRTKTKLMTTQTTQTTSLTAENASTVSTVINNLDPQWGTWRFIYNGQPLNDGQFSHIIGIGSSTKVLHEGDFKFWSVATFK